MNIKKLYMAPDCNVEPLFMEFGFALSSPGQWNDAGNGSGDFSVDSDYDNEFE